MTTVCCRVHPYHARAFARRLQERAAVHPGQNEVLYYENTEGGHAGAADAKQQAYVTTLYIRFLHKHLSGRS